MPYQVERSIPASAGEPAKAFSTADSTTVYPRECGGTCRQCPRCWRHFGLSPRVRGNPRPTQYNHLPLRSIPASAGEPMAWT